MVGIADPLCALCIALVPGVILLVIALAAGLTVSQAHLNADGQAVWLPTTESDPTGFMTWLTWLFTDASPAHVSQAIDALRQDHQQAFLLLFAGGTLAVILMVLVLLFALVAPTTIKGAPFWHRRCGLVITERETGYHPTAVRSFIRWVALIPLLPLAVLATLLGKPGLHDRLAGCQLTRREDLADPNTADENLSLA